MTSRRTPCPDPQIHISEEGAGATRCCSPRLHPQIEATEEGAEISRGRDGNSPAAPASLPHEDDMLREIILRLPPQPSSLPRASAVCWRWRRIVADPKFFRRFRVHHRKPPLLGVIKRSNRGITFTPVLDPPDRIPPVLFYSSYNCHVLDSRHGLVLVRDWAREEVVVCDPISGEQRSVDIPPEFSRGFINGAVLCAAGDQGLVRGDCLRSPFKVLLMGSSRSRPVVRVYSSETGGWGNLISTAARSGIPLTPSVLVGDCLYWTCDVVILEFDLVESSLTVIMEPPVTDNIRYGHRQIIQTDNSTVGFVILCYPHFHICQRNVSDDGVTTWLPWKTIGLHTIPGFSPQIEGHVKWGQTIRGYDEDTGAIFVNVNDCVYMVQLKLMQSRKLYKTIDDYRCHPFKCFYTPGTIIRGCTEADMLQIHRRSV